MLLLLRVCARSRLYYFTNNFHISIDVTLNTHTVQFVFSAVPLPSVTAWLCCGLAVPDSRLQMGPLLKSQFWQNARSNAACTFFWPREELFGKWKKVRWVEKKLIPAGCERRMEDLIKKKKKKALGYRQKWQVDTFSKVIQLRITVYVGACVAHEWFRISWFTVRQPSTTCIHTCTT